MSKDTDGLDFVTDNNTGGHFVCECQSCGEVFNSQDMDGGEPNADAGDYGDCYCPKCGQVDPEECTNANLVWNVQQKKINLLVAQRDELVAAYTNLLYMQGSKPMSGGEDTDLRDAKIRMGAAVKAAKGAA